MPSLPFPHHARTEIVKVGRVNMDGSQSHRVTFGTHTGTHMDTPSHMIEGAGPLLEEIPLERLIGPAKLVKLEKKEWEPILVEDLEKADLQEGDRLLISTGWSKNWGKKAYYFDYPVIPIETMNYLIEKKIGMLGIDLPAPDVMGLPAGDPMKNYNHKACFRNDILIVESLANLENIPTDRFELIVLPLCAKGMDGFPVRAVAVCDL